MDMEEEVVATCHQHHLEMAGHHQEWLTSTDPGKVLLNLSILPIVDNMRLITLLNQEAHQGSATTVVINSVEQTQSSVANAV